MAPDSRRGIRSPAVTQIDLLAESDVAQDGGGLLALGRGYALRLPQGPRAPGDLYHRGSLRGCEKTSRPADSAGEIRYNGPIEMRW